ncbi:Uncharacterized protein dnm_061110 [Desulfonema magnum]|uniref:Uncharacterized protein n=1 Tax=Desulfonema magnum TaxID=45655 RepID=A0A975BR02_9BACT|nr:Uncharacterized protein dnm_061110 [Desulfonema magnum]
MQYKNSSLFDHDQKGGKTKPCKGGIFVAAGLQAPCQAP